MELAADRAATFQQIILLGRKGNEEAALFAGSELISGENIPEDTTLAMALLEPLTEEGNAEAMALVGLLWEEGWYPEYDESDPILSQLEQSDFAVAADFYRMALAENFDPEIAYRLGTIELFGSETLYGFVAASPETGHILLASAVEHGHSGAQFLLAFTFERGLGTDRNIDLARSMYEQLAAEGDLRAQISLQRLSRVDELLNLVERDSGIVGSQFEDIERDIVTRGLGSNSAIFFPRFTQLVRVEDADGNRQFEQILLPPQGVRIDVNGGEDIFLLYSRFDVDEGTLVLESGEEITIEAADTRSADGRYAVSNAIFRESSVVETSVVHELELIVRDELGQCAVFYGDDFLTSGYSSNCWFLLYLDFFGNSAPVDTFADPRYESIPLPLNEHILRVSGGTEFEIRGEEDFFSFRVPENTTMIFSLSEQRAQNMAGWNVQPWNNDSLVSEIEYLWEPGGTPVLFDDEGDPFAWLSRSFNPQEEFDVSTGATFSVTIPITEMQFDYDTIEQLRNAYLFNQLVQYGPFNEAVAEAHVRLGLALINMGEATLAHYHIEAGLQTSSYLGAGRNEFHSEAMLLLARHYLSIGDLDLAGAAINRAISLQLGAQEWVTEGVWPNLSESEQISAVEQVNNQSIVLRAQLHFDARNYSEAADYLLEMTAREIAWDPRGTRVGFVQEFTSLAEALYYSGDYISSRLPARYILSDAKTDSGVGSYDEPLPRPFPVPTIDNPRLDIVSIVLNTADELARVYARIGRHSDATNVFRFVTGEYLERFGPGSAELAVTTAAGVFSAVVGGEMSPSEAISSMELALDWRLGDFSRRSLPRNLSPMEIDHLLDTWLVMISAAEREGSISNRSYIEEIFMTLSLFERVDQLGNLLVGVSAPNELSETDPLIQELSTWRELQSRISAIERRLSSSSMFNTANSQELALEGELRIEREQILAETLELEADLNTMMGHDENDRAPSELVAELQATMSSDEAIVIFWPLHYSVRILVVTPDGVNIETINAHRYLYNQVIEDYRLAIAWPSGELTSSPRLDEQSLDLSALLEFRSFFFDPVSDLLDGRNLIIIPFGDLRSVPFEAIPLGDFEQSSVDSRAELANIDYLGLTAEIGYFPSLTMAHSYIRDRHIEVDYGEVQFVGFGDPIIGSPTTNQRIASVFDSIFRSNLNGLSEFSQLPETAAEVRELSNIFSGGSAGIFLRENATLSNFRNSEIVQTARVLSFATHAVTAGYYNGSAVEEPYILLSIDPAVDTAPQLRMSEIMGMSLNAQLVMLSACETASSDGAFGSDGFTGLVNAFLLAGAENLLASHWTVESRSTYYFSTIFARNVVEEEMNLGAAALETRRAIFGRNGWQHPRYWSAFVLVGDLEERISISGT